MKKEIWPCTICHLPRKQVNSFLRNSISRKKNLQMHWVQLYFTEAHFESLSKARGSKKKKYPTIQSPQMTHFFSSCTCWPRHFLSVFRFLCRWRTEDFSSLSAHLGEATGGRVRDKRGGKLMPPPTCFPPLTAHPSPLHLPLYFINVSMCGFSGHTGYSLLPEEYQHRKYKSIYVLTFNQLVPRWFLVDFIMPFPLKFTKVFPGMHETVCNLD